MIIKLYVFMNLLLLIVYVKELSGLYGIINNKELAVKVMMNKLTL